MIDDDYTLALQLQSQFFDERGDASAREIDQFSNGGQSQGKEPLSLVDIYWENTDPNPDIRALFLQFNERFFWGRLAGIEIKWSPRMTMCAGLCCYEGRGGLCSVRLSVPLLKLRPRKDLVETLLHEMIHAYLFVTDNNKDHDGHGPEFHKHMYRINKEAGTSISVYHDFHDEVASYKQHWWLCDGPCRSRKPYFGHVKRSMNRAPSKNDTWWAEHQRTCGGTYTKVKEPENYGKKKKSKTEKEGKEDKEKDKSSSVKSMDIRLFGGEGKVLGQSKNSNQLNTALPKPPSNQVKPKPAATVTSLEASGSGTTTNNSRSVNYDKTRKTNQPTLPSLSGAKTPTTKGVKNKPVSQGGDAKFKKSVFVDLDFSDSDDDLLSSMPLDNDAKSIDESSNVSCDWLDESVTANRDVINDTTLSNTNNTEVSTDCSNESVQSAVDSDPNEVRAMLRKVWGEKQQNHKHSSKTKQFEKVMGKVNTSLPNTVLISQKRTSADSELEVIPAKKKPKIDGSGMKVAIQSNETSGVDKKDSRQSDKVTSPIEKLFDKMRGLKRLETQTSNIASSSSVPVENITDPVFQGGNSTQVTSTHTELSPCPICNKSVPTSSINDHLDLCLTLQAI